MKDKFNELFSNYLSDRMGAAINELRIKNIEYAKWVAERASLVEAVSNSEHSLSNIEILRLLELDNLIKDIESSHLYLMGMREWERLRSAITSPEFADYFTKMES